MEPIMKFVVGQYVNEDALANVVRYIYNGGRKLPPDQQICGANGLIDPKDPELMISQMMMTREIFACTSDPQCKHLVIAFGRKPNLPKKRIRRLMERTIGFFKHRAQYYWAVHHVREDGRENYHIHAVIGTVDMLTGKKLNVSNKTWRKFKKHVKHIWKDVESIQDIQIDL